MNQLLDSPVEALAFSYASFGILAIVNNLWTWVAVITAAVSFWRIRASGGATSSCSVKSHDQNLTTTVIDGPVPEVDEKQTASAFVSAPASVKGTSVSQVVCSNGVAENGKSKFIVYYEDEMEDEEEEESDVKIDTMATEWNNSVRYFEGVSCGGEWWESFERVLSLRKGEMGWYRYQDLTTLNGNIVRLWDESCRRGSYSTSCCVW